MPSAVTSWLPAVRDLESRQPGPPPPALPGESLDFDDTLPGFRWSDSTPRLRQGPLSGGGPRVTLRFDDDGAQVACTTCGRPCAHQAAALRATRELLESRLDETLEARLDAAARPPWQKALEALERTAVAPDAATQGEHVVWRLRIVEGDGIEVLPHLHPSATRAGVLVSPARLLDKHVACLDAHDQRLAALSQKTMGFAEPPLLEALVGHPRLVLAENPNAKVTVERAAIGLLADQREHAVVLMAALDGTPLPESLLEEPRARFLFEAGARRLTILHLPEPVAQALAAVRTHGNSFPPESHPALIRALSTLATRAPVAMPRSVMGEQVPPQTVVVLRVEPQPGGPMRIELRVRPLPECASFTPAEGPRDVHVRREGVPFHARRDFVEERNEATVWLERLPLTPVEQRVMAENEWALLLEPPARALEFLGALQAPGSAKPELEWLAKPPRLVGHLQATSLKVNVGRRREWFGLTGELSVDGERIALAVLLDAVRKGHHFVRLDPERYAALGDGLRERLAALADHVHATEQRLEMGPAAVDVLHRLGDEGAVVDADAAWARLSAAVRTAEAASPELPAGLEATLRDYQRDGFVWLMRLATWGAGAVLADEMGLGKTLQALALLLARAAEGPTLVVAPMSLGFNWREETRRFAPSLKLHLLADAKDRAALVRRLGPNDVLVASYGLLVGEAELLAERPWHTLVLDEAQALKNAATRRAQAARGLKAGFVVALTGTPVENHLGELWSLYRVVFPGLLGSWDSFRDRFAVPIEKKLDPEAAPTLARVLRPFLLRRTKSQVARELPPRLERTERVVLSSEEWQRYEDARLAALQDLEVTASRLREQERRVEILAALTRLRLLACHPRLVDPRAPANSSKVERLFVLLSGLLEGGHRVLVFSQFTSLLDLVEPGLSKRGWSWLRLDGQTPRPQREAQVRAFQDGVAPLFLVSLTAGGVGLNLTQADHVVLLDPWWNPAVEEQALGRAHRLGQTRPVTVHRLVAQGTLEEPMRSLHDEKRALVASVLDGSETAGKLSLDELEGLLRRPDEALPR